MKRSIVLILLLALLCACAVGEGNLPEDGLYSVAVDSNSKMFNITHCMLRVRGGEMTAILSLHGKGYLYLYPDSAEAAQAAPRSEWSPCFEDRDGLYCYEFPVSALDVEIPVAAFSKKYEKWYDRGLTFHSDSLKACDRLPADGLYSAVAKCDSLNLGNCTLRVRNGQMTAEFDGADWEALCLGAPENGPEAGEEAAIQLPSLDREIIISALKDGAWTEHTLYLPYDGLTALSDVPEDGVYAIDCRSDSGLLKIDSCVLRVEKGQMTAEIHVAKASYDKIYPGPISDARTADASACIPAEIDDSGCTYALPIETLEGEILISTYSDAQKSWYARKLTFDTASLTLQ